MGCGTSTDTQQSNQNRNHQNGVLPNSKAPLPAIKASLKGDYSQLQLSKYHREKQQKERQLRLYVAADELSGKVLEERERLSLGTRSRATSRNTSRTASPTNNKRSVHLNETTNPMTPVIEDRNRSESCRSDGSLNQPLIGVKKQAGTTTSKKKGKHKLKKKANKGEKSKSKKRKKGKKSKNKKHISFENEESDSGLDDTGLIIEQSGDSAAELSADDELENITDGIPDDINDTIERDSATEDIGEIKDDKYKSESVDNYSPTRGDSTEYSERRVEDGEEKSHEHIDQAENIDNTEDIGHHSLENTNDNTSILRPVVSGESHNGEVIQAEDEYTTLESDKPIMNDSIDKRKTFQETSIDQTSYDFPKGENNPKEHDCADTVLTKGDKSSGVSNGETPEIILSNRSDTHIHVHANDGEIMTPTNEQLDPNQD